MNSIKSPMLSNHQPSKLALITGASRGIGRAAVETLANQGFAIALHYRRQKSLAEQVAAGCENAQIFAADLSTTDSPRQLVQQVQHAMGPISVLVNNAGITIDKLALMSSDEHYTQILNTNLGATYQLSKAVLKSMIKQRWGRIINITSIIGHTGARGQALYGASKAAVTSFTQSLAAETGRFNVLCNCVAPGYITTEMTQDIPESVHQQIINRVHLGRPGTAAEVAQVVGFLASEHASFITGTTLHVNGGMAGF